MPETQEIPRDIFGTPQAKRQTPAHMVTIKDDADFAKVQPGETFIDPEGKQRTKAYSVENDEDFAKIPEGAEYVGPDGQRYQKPKFESVGFTAQMLFDMAQTEQSKEQALKTVYGDKVKRDELGFYVEDEGKVRRPGARDFASKAGTAASETLPAAGMAVGSELGLIGGGAAGTLVEPGGGSAVGGLAGAAGGGILGAMGGRAANNAILALAGVHQSPGETISGVGWEGAGAALGEPIGKVVSKIPGAVESVKKTATAAGEKIGGVVDNLSGLLESLGITPDRARKFLGTTPETAEQSAGAVERGYRVPPSVSAPGAPMLTKLEQFHNVFEGMNVFAEANRDAYEKNAVRILENESIGVRPDSPLTRSETKVSAREAGELVLAAAQRDMQIADAQLENATRAMRESARAPVVVAGGEKAVAEARTQEIARLNTAHQEAATAAENLVRSGIANLDREADQALLLMRHDEDPSALNRAAAAQFDAYNRTTRIRAREMYAAGDAVASQGPPPDTSALAPAAEGFLASLPESLRTRYPSEIRDLGRLAGEEGEEAAEPLTWGQLRHLRSWFRHGIDYNDLTPDMRQGSLKLFERRINAILHDPNAPEPLRQAATLLDQADAFYRQMIPFLDDTMVKSTMKALESGAGVNPNVIADTFFDPNRTAALRRVRGIVGENVWTTVQAARVKQMINRSQSLTPGAVDFAKFSSQVAEEVRNGLVETAYSPQMASRLRRLATDIGQLEGSLPVPVEATDTLSTIMRRGAIAKEQADQLAKTDPLGALSKEISRLDKEFNQSQERLRKSRRQEPLGFLYEHSMSEMATKAANRILGSEDLIAAAATQFGPESSEFSALRKVYAQRFLQRPATTLGQMRTELADPQKGITEETQALMFPGVTRDMMVQLAKDAEFLFGPSATDIGGSLAGASRVLHPAQHLPFSLPSGISGTLLMLPGISTLHRVILGKYYAMLIDAVSHPNFIYWLSGKIGGTETDRLTARAVLQERLRLGGVVGAGTGQMLLGGANQPQQPEQVQ